VEHDFGAAVRDNDLCLGARSVATEEPEAPDDVAQE
jgi:hypothetical protein